MTHTPGPWRLGDAGTTIFGPPNGRPAPQMIAKMAAHADYKANARLLAAAPELLAVLIEAVQSDELAWRNEQGILVRAVAAIAKAQG